MKNKLSTMSVFDLLSCANDKDKIAKILGPNNINKLSKIIYLIYMQYINTNKDIFLWVYFQS